MTTTTIQPATRAARAVPIARPQWARRLSVILVVLMAVAAAAGLLMDGLYRDPDSVVAMLRGYDLVTLVVAVPALATALLRRSVRAELVWLGMLAYSVYNSSIVVFGTAFNAAFLLHVAVFSLAVFALGLALANLDAAGIARQFSVRTPARTVAAILIALGAGLAAMWSFFSVRFAVTGQAPQESLLVLPAANQHLGYVLDLALLVPVSVLAGVLLWRRSAWGYVLSAMVAVFGLVYQFNYVVALLSQWRAGIPGAIAFDPQEPLIVAAYLLATALLYGSVAGRRTPPPHRQSRRSTPR